VNVEKVKRKGIGSAVGGEKGEAWGAVLEAIASVRDIPAHLEAR